MSDWHSLGNRVNACALFVFLCVAPGSTLRMSERGVRRGVTSLSVKRCEGDLFTLGRHITLMGLEQSGSRSALWLLQDLVRIHKQTVVHPTLPTPSPLPLLLCYLVSQGYPVMSGKLGSLSGHCKQAVKPIVSAAVRRKSCFHGLVTIIKTEV